MSLPSKITLGAAVVISSAIIGYVHYKQSEDRLKLHEGVLRDIEQQQRRKNENIYTLQQQSDMAKQLKQLEGSGRQGQMPNPPVEADKSRSNARLDVEAAAVQSDEAPGETADASSEAQPVSEEPIAKDEIQQQPPEASS
ncbi:uncharacterized protein LOC115631319 [Scaptodrosophila lebanonensis]|uniref:Uncharacterized protein LOC115631319 n=1 Tax=Drosophila lebanonensis TaxID=7225 RepID=A0A6J2U7E9_DROLE|nr:uncharacterized protein LOC115631319 [Scaptodrosophila lebanonensis]XP_030383895.1 uncharacterized protein LOC115631319 [Scaptodrosophila lebanonensis]